MAKKLILFFACFLFSTFLFSQKNSIGNKTHTYFSCIEAYQSLTKKYANITLENVGLTDAGYPLQLIKITNQNHSVNKVKILINNGIHPGEPEGIDASVYLAEALLGEKNTLFPKGLNVTLLNDCEIFIIPIYNIDGAINRNSNSRANQNGPDAYGFRANARNLDLNRDFIKMDSRNAFAFVEIFQKIQPHIFIDTHTSNGADYQHVLTYIATQKDKLSKPLAALMTEQLVPAIVKSLNEKKWNPIPYVNAWTDSPDAGWSGFYESPRYASGYTTLFNCIGFTVETHMLKPFDQRAAATADFLKASIENSARLKTDIIAAKEKAIALDAQKKYFPLNWKVDSSKNSLIDFKGYRAKQKPSMLSGKNRLYYDRNEPLNTTVKYLDSYRPTDSVAKPFAYIIPFAWKEVIERLRANHIKIESIGQNLSNLKVHCYYLSQYQTLSKPYEGHYLHYNTKPIRKEQMLNISTNDFIVYTDQVGVRFIMETLEPQAIDSYFNWNFFDACLGQKEGYSDYVFEDIAAEILKTDTALNNLLQAKVKSDPAFANNGAAQLDFVYQHSPYFEKSYLRYPIYRIENKSDCTWK